MKIISLKPLKWYGEEIYASSICPDKIFFVLDKSEIVPDKIFVQGKKSIFYFQKLFKMKFPDRKSVKKSFSSTNANFD